MQDRNKILSEGLLIAVVPLVGYAVAFAYEYGYTNYYGLPWQFISLTLSQILGTTGAMILVLVVVFPVLNIVYTLHAVYKDKHPVVTSLVRVTLSLLPLLALLSIFGSRWRVWGSYAVIVVLFALMEFLFPLIAFHDKETYAEKLAAAEAHDRNVPNLADRAGIAFGNGAVILMALFVLTCSPCLLAGVER